MSYPTITDVTIKNYKSIGQCHVELGKITVLIGQNGSGKSNFLDALQLLSDALNSTLEYAIRQRGGISEVRRRSGGHPTHFVIRLRLKLTDTLHAGFAFRAGSTAEERGFTVQQEALVIREGKEIVASYESKEGNIVKKSENLTLIPATSSDRLFLTAVSALPEFRPVFDALSKMHFYNINPADIRAPQPHASGEVLSHTGGNLPSVLRRLSSDDPDAFARIEEYARRIVSGIDGIEYRALGPTETIEFRQRVQNIRHPWRFYAAAMSDGTLRSVGILTALFQTDPRGNPPTLIGIEEPESTIHPGAAAILTDALIEGSARHQVLVTTHSPDLLDHPGLQLTDIRVVDNVNGETRIETADVATRTMLKDELFTAGELLRKNQIRARKTKSDEIRTPDLFRL